MLTVQVTQVIECTPDELLRFVMDPDRHEFAFWARVAGIPGSVTVSRVDRTGRT
jgi:hypothetical protein